MYTISKEFSFSAAHQLNGLPADHQCSRLHGHNYRVVVELQSETLNGVSFVRDYGDLKVVKNYLDQCFDHRNLNDLFHPTQTSAENIARYLYEQFAQDIPELSAIRVSETDKTWAEYRP